MQNDDKVEKEAGHDNPFLITEFTEAIKKQTNPNKFRREYLGEFVEDPRQYRYESAIFYGSCMNEIDRKLMKFIERYPLHDFAVVSHTVTGNYGEMCCHLIFTVKIEREHETWEKL